MITDTIGFVATVVTLSSFAVNNQLKLRFLNLSGAVIWVFYGLMISSNPVLLTNALIIVFHLRWLYFNWWK